MILVVLLAACIAENSKVSLELVLNKNRRNEKYCGG